MSRYFKKQFIILFIFLVIVFAVGASIFFLTRDKEETSCFDGIQNQREEGIDCGGPCITRCEKSRQDLEITYDNFIPTTQNNYDLVAEIKNPNNSWGATSIDYTFYLYDENYENTASRQGSIYILPQETKYIVEPKVFSEIIPQSMELKIGKITWEKVTGLRDLVLRMREKNIQSGQGVPNRVYGVIENNTNYDLNKVEITGIVYGADDKIIAAGKTLLTTLLMGEDRYFEIGWPYVISEPIFSYDIKTYVNVYADDAFINVRGNLPSY